MNDPWANVREWINNSEAVANTVGISPLAFDIAGLLSDADALLVAKNSAQYMLETDDYEGLRMALAALPEHLRGK